MHASRDANRKRNTRGVLQGHGDEKKGEIGPAFEQRHDSEMAKRGHCDRDHHVGRNTISARTIRSGIAEARKTAGARVLRETL